MPGKPEKPHRLRARAVDGQPREWNKLKGQLGSYLDIIDVKEKVEFIICGVTAKQIEQVRAQLGGVGLEELSGGDTTVAPFADAKPTAQPARQVGGFQNRGGPQQRGGQPQRAVHPPQPARAPATSSTRTDLRKKPYGFVPLPKELTSEPPVWHDGTSSAGRLSGEVRFELETLTPFLVGWRRGQLGDAESDWPLPANLEGAGPLAAKKSVLCPLRAPWEKHPVVIPGDTLKGLLRHELGALLGAPMERVAERSYSYRPNLKYPDRPEGRFLEPRLARVRAQATIDIDGSSWPVPEQLDILSMATRDEQAYFPRRERGSRDVIRPTHNAEPYRGGMGGGRALPDAVLSEDARRKLIHTHIDVQQLRVEHSSVRPMSAVIDQYAATLTHLLDTIEGHFSSRHPNTGMDQQKQGLGREAVMQGAQHAFQPGDLIWVEWDTEKRSIVSLGWHYYYRWAYTDSVRRTGGRLERRGLFPLGDELKPDADGAPTRLTAVRRLFGYTGDNPGSSGIGREDHVQLMGRVSVNAGLEVVGDADTDETRFLEPTFLKELGMPRPSAVEHYLQQPNFPNPMGGRPDKAQLLTYGDATGYDAPGELAGRKFYLDRNDTYASERKWQDDSEANRLSERSTLALEASKPNRRFRFTIRFHDLDASELAAIVVALCPHQFKEALGGKHPAGYCSKLGYARPLGWGTVRIEAKAMFFLDGVSSTPTLKPQLDIEGWVTNNHEATKMQNAWLEVHRHKHPDARDYPRGTDGQIFTFHTSLRAEHSRSRRYR